MNNHQSISGKNNHGHTVCVLLFFLLFLFSGRVYSQEFIEKLTNIFEFDLGKESEDSTVYQTKLVLAPVIAFEPSTSLQFGVGSKLLFKFKDSGLDTRTSNLPFSATYTLRNQFILSALYTVFTNHEKYLIRGRARYLNYPFSYYGKGSTSKEEDVLDVELQSLLFSPLVLRKVANKLFLGGGIRYNSAWNASLVEHENRNSNSTVDSLNTLASGVVFALNYDSRDNVLNALDGYFVQLSHEVYGKALGGDNRFTVTNFNARKYVRLKKSRLDVLGFELFSRFSWGDVPLFELSALGGRELLRGYQEQRFNDRHALFAQTEYRWQALPRLGFVGFTGVGDVFSSFTDDFKLRNLKYSLGTGLRIKIVKSENLNIRLDYALGLGPSNDHNFYLGLAEAF